MVYKEDAYLEVFPRQKTVEDKHVSDEDTEMVSDAEVVEEATADDDTIEVDPASEGTENGNTGNDTVV